MTTQERVIEIFAKHGIDKNAVIHYNSSHGENMETTVENFGYIVEQVDTYGVVHLPVLALFDRAEDIMSFAGNLTHMINKSIEDGSFTPITADVNELYEGDFEDEE